MLLPSHSTGAEVLLSLPNGTGCGMFGASGALGKLGWFACCGLAFASVRRRTCQPAAVNKAATASKRCGWRGTMSHCRLCSRCCWLAGRACRAASSSCSSPSRLLASMATGRGDASACCHNPRRWRPCCSRVGSGVASNLRLPVTCTARACKVRSRCASASLCA